MERNEEFMVLRQRLERIEQETGTLRYALRMPRRLSVVGIY